MPVFHSCIPTWKYTHIFICTTVKGTYFDFFTLLLCIDPLPPKKHRQAGTSLVCWFYFFGISLQKWTGCSTNVPPFHGWCRVPLPPKHANILQNAALLPKWKENSNNNSKTASKDQEFICHLHVIKCFDLTCSSRTTLKILCILTNEVMVAPEVWKQLGGFPTELPVLSTTSCQSQQLLSPWDSQSLFSTFFCQVSKSNLSCLGDNISPIS